MVHRQSIVVATAARTRGEILVISYPLSVHGYRLLAISGEGAVRTSVTLLVQNMGNTLLLIVYNPFVLFALKSALTPVAVLLSALLWKSAPEPVAVFCTALTFLKSA